MAGAVKRKASRSAATNGRRSVGGANGKRKRASDVALHKSSSAAAQGSSSGGESDDDFDDDQDLLAQAMNGNGDEQPSDDDVGQDDDDDDNVNMYSDEDMEGGFIDVQDEEKGAGNNEEKAILEKGQAKSLYAIPSRDEMDELKNTSGLFKSNIFRLKIDEMLKEVRPKYEKADALNYVLRHIKTCVESMKPIEPSTLPSASKKLSLMYKANVRIPFPEPAPKADSPLKFAFEPPTTVQIAGSWILKTAALRPEGVDVDMVVTMPSSLFQEKDHMNLRYFYKRAFYLAAVASAISTDSSISVDCAFVCNEDDPRRPYLLLTSKRDGSQSDFFKTKAQIKVHLAHESDLFSESRLSPLRNNIRMGKVTTSDEAEESVEQAPTPHYNASILRDSLYVQHMVYLYTTSATCKEFEDAAVLLKVWSAQRALGSGKSKAEIKGKDAAEKHRRKIAFGSSNVRFVLTMILAHLLNGAEKVNGGAPYSTGSMPAASISRLSPGFSSYQLFRGVLDFLANHKFDQQPLFMKSVDGIISRRNKIHSADFTAQAENVLVDPTGSINLLQSLSHGSLEYLQREARSSLALLNDAEDDHFDAIFLRDQSTPMYHFDELTCMDLADVKTDVLLRADTGSSNLAGISQAVKTLKQGLSNRQTDIATFGQCFTSWPITETQTASETLVDVGVNLDPAQAFRLVDHGPRPEDTEAAEAFKQFWGDLSELRRFRDGRIVESVVWTANGPFERLTIPRRIIAYTCERHLQIALDENADFVSSAFDPLLVADEQQMNEAAFVPASVLPSKVGFQPAQNAFDELVKALRGLEDLPLSLISVVANDAGLRGTSAMIPCALPAVRSSFSASYMPALEFVMTFESSGHWPDDLVAIRAMKMAFYESMALKLNETLDGCEARIALDVDADENKLWDASSLEVIVATRFAFRGRIHHAREEVLLQRILEDDKSETYKQRQARAALERYDVRFVHSVRHHNHVAAIGHRFASYAQACRLTKRWINGQLFGNQVPDELIELLVAKVYIDLSRAPNNVPSRAHVGFAQTLRLLATWQWRDAPLRVPMSGATSAVPLPSMTMNDARRVDANFAQLRKLDPGMHHLAWFIATEDERKGVCWATAEQSAPTVATADALNQLAKAACRALENQRHINAAFAKSLFVPSLDHFDFIVHLEPAALDRYVDNLTFDKSALKLSQKRLENDESTSSLIAGKATTRYRNLAGSTSSADQSRIAGLNVGQSFVQLLESLYLDSFRVYYDTLGGQVIGGLFNPSLSKPRGFRVGLGFNSMPIEQESVDGAKDKERRRRAKDIVLNQAALMEEIRRIGAGLVHDVVLQQ